MTDRLCIYSSRFSGDLKLLKSMGKGDSSEMSVSRASGVCQQRCRVFACLLARARMCSSSQAATAEGTSSVFSNTCYSCGQSSLLTHDISARLISFSCRGQQDQTNVV